MNFVTMTMPLRMLVLCAVALSAAWAQTKEFDVASIKPHKGDDGRIGINMSPGGLFRAENVPLRELIQIAYDLRPGQLAGAPKWIDTERYDIEAKMAEPPPPGSPDGLRPYIQSLLATRFQMKSHREMRDMQSYLLVEAKGGHKLKEAAAEERGGMIRMGRDQLTLTKCTIEELVRPLSRAVGAPVTNQTGLTGKYDMELKFAPEGPAGPGGHDGGSGPATAPGGDAPSIFTAVQEQLGLKLEAKKSPVNVLVIDKIEKPEEN